MMKESVLFLQAPKQKEFVNGIMFTVLIAGISFVAANISFIRYAGLLALSILIAVLYRSTIGCPEQWRAGHLVYQENDFTLCSYFIWYPVKYRGRCLRRTPFTASSGCIGFVYSNWSW
jgi:hypothetical protein